MKYKSYRSLAAVAAIAIPLAGAIATQAFAEEEGKQDAAKKSLFQKMDKDADGKVTKVEFQAARKKMPAEKVDEFFKKKDKDADGALSEKEMGKPKPKKEAESEE